MANYMYLAKDNYELPDTDFALISLILSHLTIQVIISCSPGRSAADLLKNSGSCVYRCVCPTVCRPIIIICEQNISKSYARI